MRGHLGKMIQVSRKLTDPGCADSPQTHLGAFWNLGLQPSSRASNPLALYPGETLIAAGEAARSPRAFDRCCASGLAEGAAQVPQDGIRLVQGEVSILELGELAKQLGEDSSVRGADPGCPQP